MGLELIIGGVAKERVPGSGLEVPKGYLHYEEGYEWKDGCKDNCIDDLSD